MSIPIKQIQGLQSALNGKQPFDINIVSDADYNNFSLTEKNKLLGIEPEAQVNDLKTANIETVNLKQLEIDDDYFQLLTPSVANSIVRLPNLVPTDICEFEIVNVTNGLLGLTIEEFNQTAIITLQAQGTQVRSIYAYWKIDTWHVWERSYYGSDESLPIANLVVIVEGDVVDTSIGNYYFKSITANTSLSFINAYPTGIAHGLTLEVEHIGGAIIWPSNVSWPGSLAPVLSAGYVHIFTFVTIDGGVKWRGTALTSYPSDGLTIEPEPEPEPLQVLAPHAQNSVTTVLEGQTASFWINISLNRPSDYPTTVTYTLTGTAQINVHYEETIAYNGSITIPAGSNGAAVGFRTIDNSTQNPDYSIILTVTGASNSGETVTYNNTQVVIWIIDDD